MGDRMGSLTPVQRAALADALTSLEDTFDPGSGVSRS
jgi:hypothetical protein